MDRPSEKDYREALDSRDFLKNALYLENKTRDNLIHKLCKSQNCIDSYSSSLEHINETILKYELYKELLNERTKKEL